MSCMNLRTQNCYVLNVGRCRLWGLFLRINCHSEDDVALLHLGDMGTYQLERKIAWSKRVFKKSNSRGSSFKKKKNSRGSDQQTERSEFMWRKILQCFYIYIYPIPYVSALSYFRIQDWFRSGPLFVFETPQKMLKSLPKFNTYACDKNHMQSNYFFFSGPQLKVWNTKHMTGNNCLVVIFIKANAIVNA